MEIKDQACLEMVLENKVVYGLDQDWYRTRIQQRAGCGPVTAASLLLYKNKRENGPLRYSNAREI